MLALKTDMQPNLLQQMKSLNLIAVSNERRDKLISNARQFLIENVDADLLKNYELPVHPSKESKYIIPVSGGKDSTCAAIVLAVLFPHIQFTYVFTDTMAEPEDIYRNIRELEKMLNIEVIRLKHPLGLFGYIEKHGGFLPSQKNRFCTPILKIEVIDKWFQESFNYEDQMLYTMVGFTYGEDRVGMITDEAEVQSVFPLIDLKITTEMVFELLDRTIGVSGIYRSRSRSGCFCCPYQRKYEKCQMLIERPDEFARAKSYEKLTNEDEARYTLAKHPALKEALFGSNAIPLSSRQEYFIPPAIDVRTEFLEHADNPTVKKLKDKLSMTKHQDQMSIFDVIDDFEDDQQQSFLYVAVGFWVNSIARDYHADWSWSGLYRTEFSTFSRDLAGLRRSLHFYVEHKLGVAPIYVMTKEDMLKDLKIGLFQIKVNKPIIEALKDMSKGSFGWSQADNYAQIETILRLANTVLTYEGLLQTWNTTYKHRHNLSDDELWHVDSWAYSTKQQLSKYEKSYKSLDCHIEWSGAFPLPDQDAIDDLHMEAIIGQDKELKASAQQMCAICSI